MAIVLEVPLAGADEEKTNAGEAVEAKTSAKCEYPRGNGQGCRMPAREGDRYCERHAWWIPTIPATAGMPYPEDAPSLQELMARARWIC